jgi:hypothetical protein
MTYRSDGTWLAALAIVLPAGTALAQEPTSQPPSIEAPGVHVGYVADAYHEAPGGVGLLPTAIAEAQVASQHAELAAGELYDVGALKSHVMQVLHALDPGLVVSGAGLGYGVRRAAQGIADHMERASAGDDASDNVRTHARHVIGSARSVIARSDRMVSLAQRVQSESSISTATSLASLLHAEAQALFAGRDADGDGLVGWAAPEGGLRQIQQHVTLLKRGEALIQGGVRP